MSGAQRDQADGHSRMRARGHRPDTEAVSLEGIVLPDSRTGALVDLGAAPALALVSLIRHRY